MVSMELNLGGFLKGGFWVTNCHQSPPPRCRMYGSIPLARLQPKTPYNASWSSPAIPLTPNPQSPAPSKSQQEQHPQKWPPQQEGSQHPSKDNATALQATMASPMPDVAPIAGLDVTHSGLEGAQGVLKPQGELRTQARGFLMWGGVLPLCMCGGPMLLPFLLQTLPGVSQLLHQTTPQQRDFYRSRLDNDTPL